MGEKIFFRSDLVEFARQRKIIQMHIGLGAESGEFDQIKMRAGSRRQYALAPSAVSGEAEMAPFIGNGKRQRWCFRKVDDLVRFNVQSTPRQNLTWSQLLIYEVKTAFELPDFGI